MLSINNTIFYRAKVVFLCSMLVPMCAALEAMEARGMAQMCCSRTATSIQSIQCTKKAGLHMLCIVCGAKVQTCQHNSLHN